MLTSTISPTGGVTVMVRPAIFFIHYKYVQKIAGLTITVTPPVGEIVEVNIFLRPGRSHVGNL